MVNTFEGAFTNSSEKPTRGPNKSELVPAEFKKEAVKALIKSNTIEPLAFQLGAISFAKLTMNAEKKGLSSHWYHWLHRSDVEDINRITYEAKIRAHTKHGVPLTDEDGQPKSNERPQLEMYGLFREYAIRSKEVHGFIDHHLGNWVKHEDLYPVLEWLETKRTSMHAENKEYRDKVAGLGSNGRLVFFRKLYEKLYDEFLETDLYNELSLKMKNRRVENANKFEGHVEESELKDIQTRALESHRREVQTLNEGLRRMFTCQLYSS